MIKLDRKIVFRSIVILFLAMVFFYLSPYLLNIHPFKHDSLNAIHEDESFSQAMIRTVTFSILSSVIVVSSSLFFALKLSMPTAAKTRIRFISFLLLPCLLGNVSAGFIWKLLLNDYSFFFKNSINSFIVLLFMQFWQFGTLIIYLFWLNIRSINKSSLQYGVAVNLTRNEITRDIKMPALKNLLLLLLSLQFIFSFYEEAKLQFIFRSSRGTGNELIAQWLGRIYSSSSLINTDYAFKQIATISLIPVISIVCCLILLLTSALFIYKKYIHSASKKVYTKSFNEPAVRLSLLLIVIFLFIIFFPLIYSTVRYYHYTPHSMSPLLQTFVYSFGASIIATIFSIVFGVAARLGWPATLSSFNSKSLIFLILIFSIQLIPPVILLASGYDLMKDWIGSSSLNISILWITGQTLICFPLLGSFIFFTHFTVSNKYIDYLRSQKATAFEIFKTIFWGQLKGRYLLTLLIAFSLIWNEHVLNRILSDFIPSFISRMQMVITGRLTDYALGIEYLFVSFLLALSAILIWNYLSLKRVSNKDEF